MVFMSLKTNEGYNVSLFIETGDMFR